MKLTASGLDKETKYYLCNLLYYFAKWAKNAYCYLIDIDNINTKRAMTLQIFNRNH